MAKGYIGIDTYKAYLGAAKMKKGYIGATCVYSVGNIVTYATGNGTYQEEVDEGQSCLSPKTFTPVLSGWTFIGWRADKTASGSVLASLAMGEEPMTLYAVFRQVITVTYYNNSTSASKATGYRYYNNGNVANPSFKLMQAASTSGLTARGWSTTNKGNASITYNNGAAFTRDSNITLYGLYQQTITLSYAGNGNTGGSTVAQTGTRYWAPAGYINPSFTVKANGFTKTNYIFTRWKSGSTAYAVGQVITLSSNLVLTAQWSLNMLSSQLQTTGFSVSGNTYILPEKVWELRTGVATSAYYDISEFNTLQVSGTLKLGINRNEDPSNIYLYLQSESGSLFTVGSVTGADKSVQLSNKNISSLKGRYRIYLTAQTENDGCWATIDKFVLTA